MNNSESTLGDLTPKKLDVQEFCEKIGYTDLRYLNIDKAFVRPRSFATIESILDEYHIVCITGDPFVGKSYAALYLLYQLYLQGYEVVRPERRELNSVVTDLIYNLHERLSGQKAIFLDDPFGQHTFERLQPLSTDFLKLKEAVIKTNSRIIISSRSELFEKGLDSLMNSTDVNNIRVHLNLGQTLDAATAYSRDDLEAVFQKYIQLYTPSWATNTNLTAEIRTIALSELQTPPSLEYFISGYRGETFLNRNKLEHAIRNSRNDNIVPAFAGEIANSPVEDIAFWLLFSIILEDIRQVQTIYESSVLTTISNSSQTAWQACIQKYRNKFTEYVYAGKSFWKFYHPILLESIAYAVSAEEKVDGVLGLVYTALLENENPFILVDVADSILRQYPITSQSRRKLLERLISHPNYLVRAGVAASLIKHLIDVPAEYRSHLEDWLLKLADDEDSWVSRNVAVAIAGSYNLIARISPRVIRIFDDLSRHKDPNVRYAVAEAVLWYYSDIPQLHSYLWAQANDTSPLARGLFADAIVWQFGTLSSGDHDKVLSILERYVSSDTAEVKGWVKMALAWHWDSLHVLPEVTLKQIWEPLSVMKDIISEESAAKSLEWHHRYFEKYKPQFIGALTSSAIRPTEYTGIMQTMFWGAELHTFPKFIEDYFIQLATSDNPTVRGWASFAFTVRKAQFSAINQSILQKLVLDDSPVTRGIVAHCLAANYSRDEANAQIFLEKLANDIDILVRSEVSRAINSLASEVPLPKRTILENLAKQ